MRRPRISLLLVVATLFGLSGLRPSTACTLWGATGEAVKGGGTLIAKNRDWIPDHRQELAVLEPAQGYKSLVLKAVGGEEPGIKAGVNDRGLVIVTASASQVENHERRKIHQRKELMGHLLATCSSVEEVLGKLEWMRRPLFFMFGDRKGLAVVEIAPDGRASVTRRNSGTLSHTNHYISIDAQRLRKPTTSSAKRYERIEALLENRTLPFTMEDFIRFAGDRSGGPDYSLWRTGSHPGRTRTLATWLAWIPVSGSPHLSLKIANPGEPERIYHLKGLELSF